jgi:superkiller protein 3
VKLRTHRPTFLLTVILALACRGVLGSDAAAEKLFKEGFDSIRRADFATAQAQIEAGLKIDTRSPAGYDLLGIALDGQRLFPEAEAAYRRALELNPNFVAARNDLGRSLYRQGKTADAAREFTRALQVEPTSFAANFNLGVISLAAKNYSKAAKFLEIAAGDAPSDAQTLFALTEALLGAGEQERAFAVGRRIVASAPGDASFHFSLGTLFLEWKLYSEAVDELEHARTSEPRNFELLYNLGQAYRHVKKYSEAEDAFLQALSIQGSAEALYQLALVYVESKHADEAIQILVRARRLAPARPDVLLLLGRECIQEGFIEDAVGVLEDCVRIDPGKVEPHLLLGEALTKDKQFPRALNEYEKVAALEPQNPQSYVLLARTLWYAGQRQESERMLHKALALDPRSVEAAYYLGLFASNEANYPLAEKWLEQALKYDPHHFGALYEMGTTYMRARDYVRAREYLERARTESPTFSQLHYRLAAVYRRLGDDGRAAESLELFKKYGQADAQRRTYYPQGLLEFVNETQNLPDRQRLERYRAVLLKSEEKNGDDPDLLWFLAQVFLKLGQKPEALDRLEKIRSRAPDDVQAQLRAATLLASFHDYSEAAQTLEAFLQKHPGAKETRLALASIYFETRRDDQALKILVPPEPGSSPSAASHNLMGRLASRAGDSTRALEEFRSAVDLAPRNEDYAADLALELAFANRIEESRGLLEKARKDFPASGRIFFAEGVWHQLAGHRAESESAFRRAADLMGPWEPPYLALGNMLREHASPQEALEALNQAETLFSASPWPHWLKALALEKRGANSESQSEFRRAQDLASNEPEILPALLATSLRRGDCQAAGEISTRMADFGFANEVDIGRRCSESTNSAKATGPAMEKMLAPYWELKLLVEMARERPGLATAISGHFQGLRQAGSERLRQLSGLGCSRTSPKLNPPGSSQQSLLTIVWCPLWERCCLPYRT